jgi:hypothetical protein
MDGRIVNICDDAPTTLYEMVSLWGADPQKRVPSDLAGQNCMGKETRIGRRA